MNPNNYVDSFIKFDIIATQIPDVCIDYYKDKMNFDYPFERLLCAQKYLDYAITPNIGFPISRTALNVGSMIKKNEIEQFFEIIKNTNKDYNKIKIALSNHNYYAEVYSFLQNKLAFSKTEAEDIIINYIIDPSLTEVKKRKLEELKKLIDEVLIKEEENRLKIVDFYIDLLTFWEKDTKTIEDYKLLVEKLLLNDISSELVESLLYYYLQNEKNEMKKESKKSKKQIKRELAMYYEEDKNLPFDYHNLGKLLKLLQESNYADSVKITILNGIWQNKIENEAYYAYLLEKNRWNKTEKEKTKEIEEILELMCYAENKEEWEYYHDEALKICATLDSSVASMDYEMNLMRKK